LTKGAGGVWNVRVILTTVCGPFSPRVFCTPKPRLSGHRGGPCNRGACVWKCRINASDNVVGVLICQARRRPLAWHWRATWNPSRGKAITQKARLIHARCARTTPPWFRSSVRATRRGHPIEAPGLCCWWGRTIVSPVAVPLAACCVRKQTRSRSTAVNRLCRRSDVASWAKKEFDPMALGSDMRRGDGGRLRHPGPMAGEHRPNTP